MLEREARQLAGAAASVATCVFQVGVHSQIATISCGSSDDDSNLEEFLVGELDAVQMCGTWSSPQCSAAPLKQIRGLCSAISRPVATGMLVMDFCVLMASVLEVLS